MRTVNPVVAIEGDRGALGKVEVETSVRPDGVRAACAVPALLVVAEDDDDRNRRVAFGLLTHLASPPTLCTQPDGTHITHGKCTVPRKHAFLLPLVLVSPSHPKL